MRMLAIIACTIGALCIAIWFATDQRSVAWEQQSGGLVYRIISDGPRWGEGHFIALEVVHIRTGKTFYFRRLVGGLDTGGFPGFKSASLEASGGIVRVTHVDNGGSELTANIPVYGFQSDWGASR